jgi:hypothetical protein
MSTLMRALAAGISLWMILFHVSEARAQSEPPIFEICDLDGPLVEAPRTTVRRGIYTVVLHVQRARPMRIGPVRGSSDCQEYLGKDLLIEALPLRRRQVAAMLPGVHVDIKRSSMDKSDRHGNYLGTQVEARLQSIAPAQDAAAESQ